MNIPIFEQETTISYSRDDDSAFLWTNSTTEVTRLDNLCKINPTEYKCYDVAKAKDGSILSKSYCFPQKYISFRT